jgi:photosystem II stability/assembly factor-like uncharacterized protein
MKKIVLGFVLFFLISFTVNAQWQQQQASPVGLNVYDIKVINEMTMILVGDSIYKSTDGGLNWTNKSNFSFGISLESVCFVDSEVGWTCSYDGKLFKTTDSGESWFQQNTSFSDSFSKVFFSSREYGWLLTDNRLCKSTNGGDSWQIGCNGYFSDVTFVSDNVGWAAGFYPNGTGNYSLIKTTNFGLTWEEKYTYQNNLTESICFISELTGWMIDGNYLIKTTDGGDTWNSYPIQASSIRCITFIDSLKGTMCGSSIYNTTDGGITWTKYNISPGTNFLSIDFYNEEFGMLVGNRGLLLKTTDSGNTWQDYLKIVDADLSSVHFINENIGWAVGYDRLQYNRGIILKTSNGGIEWHKQLLDSLTQIKSVHFINKDTGFALSTRMPSTQYALLKTTDAGSTWIDKTIDGINYVEKLFFIDANTGWIVGMNGLIYKTTDGGESWIDLSLFSDTYLYSIQFLDKNNGWLSGSAGSIFFTSDGGLNWEPQTSGVFANLTEIYFIDSNHGWAIGGAYDNYFFIRTTDGGNIWSILPIPQNERFEALHFIDQNTGWIIGNSSINKIYKTIDGGQNWIPQLTYYFNSVYDIWFSDSNNGWVVGYGHNIILHTTNGGVTFIDDEENNFTQPKDFLLQQNYPNPFNPSTKISWQSPVGSWQTLKVYDILGNEVATLVNEYRSAGSYEVDFQSTAGSHQLANGVYFYQLRVGDFVETKKMILLK